MPGTWVYLSCIQGYSGWIRYFDAKNDADKRTGRTWQAYYARNGEDFNFDVKARAVFLTNNFEFGEDEFRLEAREYGCGGI